MDDQLSIAEIQHAVLEYRGVFKEPITRLWYAGRQGEVIASLHKAIAPWGVGLENISWQQQAKNLSEIQITFGIPTMLASVQVGVGGVTMNAINPDWSRAAQFISLFQTSVDSILQAVGQEFEFQQTTLGFHIQESKKPFRDTLGQFVNARSLGSENAAMFGVSVYYDDSVFVIDKSFVFPGGVFVRLMRTFAKAVRFDEMAAIVYKDEEMILSRLGLRVK